MDPSVAYSLFDLWRIAEVYSPGKLRGEIRARFIRPFCTGPGSMDYRYIALSPRGNARSRSFSQHIIYHRELESCTDSCSLEDEPRCFEIDLKFCPIPPQCDQSISIVGVCYRRYVRQSV